MFLQKDFFFLLFHAIFPLYAPPPKSTYDDVFFGGGGFTFHLQPINENLMQAGNKNVYIVQPMTAYVNSAFLHQVSARLLSIII